MQRFLGVVMLMVLSGVASAQPKPARMATVTPETGKPGTDFTVAGESLAKDTVKELYLTNGKDDIKVAIVTQKAEAILFKAPGTLKPGRYGLMILTADGKNFIEQPVKLTIE